MEELGEAQALTVASTGSRIWRRFARRIAPAFLLVLSLGAAMVSGLALGGAESSLGWGWQALPFAFSVLLGVGGHALGHFVTARRYGVDASFPYFLPQVGLAGTGGAYVKLQWPIDDRRVLIRVFAAGPIAGFLISVPMLFVGLVLSEPTPRDSDSLLQLGDSLLTLAMQRVMFPELSENETVLAHPIFLAGYVSLNFGVWQLLPVGRFDGGRVVYALLGRRRAVYISWVTIAGLVSLSLLSPVWLGYAVLGCLALIGIKRQHPVERHIQEFDSTSKALAAIMFAIFVLTFVPIPARLWN